MPLPGGLAKGGGGLVVILMLAAVFILPQVMGGGLGGALGGALEEGSLVSPATDGGSNATGGGTAPCDSELEQILCGATDDVAVF